MTTSQQSRKLKTRLEQIKQARRIHGGSIKMAAALVGVKLSRVPVPRPLRKWLYRKVYGGKYAPLPEHELERPLDDYRSLNDLFTHGMRPDLRPLVAGESHYLSPCDGTVQEIGVLNRDTLLTVKGIEYTLSDLLPGIDARPFEGGAFGIFFLSPRDCHRVFSPQRAVLQEIIHVPGRRLLVHPPFQRKEFPVFSLNERVIMPLETPLGACALVMVAGWGVGHITFPFMARMAKLSKKKITRHALKSPLQLEAGEWLATFELGSTAILITQPRAGLTPRVALNEPIRYRQVVMAENQ